MGKRDKRPLVETDVFSVYDAALGCHIGSLPSEAAVALANLLDKFGKTLRVLARIPRGSKAIDHPGTVNGPFDVVVELMLCAPADAELDLLEYSANLRACGISDLVTN